MKKKSIYFLLLLLFTPSFSQSLEKKNFSLSEIINYALENIGPCFELMGFGHSELFLQGFFLKGRQ